MLRNRVWLLAAILALSIPLLATNAPAWEFTMDGTFTSDFDYITQGGPNGFFGPYDNDFSAKPFYLETANAWLGQRAGNNLVSGSDYSRNSQYMSTNMDLKINPAVRVRGVYYIGEWSPVSVAGVNYGIPNSNGAGNLVASEYQQYRYSGVQRSMSPGYWNTLWLTAQLPWGTFTIGKRPSIWGTGLAWNGTDSRSSEQAALFANYGPLAIGMGLYLSRRGSTENNAATPDYFNLDFDKNNKRVYDFTLPNITYRSGPLDMGVQFNFVKIQRGNERFIGVNKTLSGGSGRPTRDRDDFYGGAYVKYKQRSILLQLRI